LIDFEFASPKNDDGYCVNLDINLEWRHENPCSVKRDVRDFAYLYGRYLSRVLFLDKDSDKFSIYSYLSSKANFKKAKEKKIPALDLLCKSFGPVSSRPTIEEYHIAFSEYVSNE
jgi:hypothetical protein